MLKVAVSANEKLHNWSYDMNVRVLKQTTEQTNILNKQL